MNNYNVKRLETVACTGTLYDGIWGLGLTKWLLTI